MKLLSIVIPCYNSQEYMKYCIESLLAGGEDVELLLINDGSVDETAVIADRYAAAHPSIVKVCHQANGGHGEAVNAGIRVATGMFLKVVDSDDWVDTRAYLKILQKIREFAASGETIDLIISNFVYEKEGANYKKVMKYQNVLPEGQVFTWNEVGRFRKGQYLMMHSLIYRTQLLRDCALELPKHTFYVDNLFVYQPLKHVKKLYYINVEFYRYLIGREDQSINEKVMIRRVDQQIRVNKRMIEQVDLDSVGQPNLRRYLLHHLEIVTVVSAILLIRSGRAEDFRKKKELWRYIQTNSPDLYYRLKFGFLGGLISLPGKWGRRISLSAYKISQKLVGFN
ncbi:putative glycosyltransferase EpsH [compost metagenome]